jgi:hypothetical protein
MRSGNTLSVAAMRILGSGLVAMLVACGGNELDANETETSSELTTSTDGYVPFAEFLDAVKAQAITLAWDDGSIHRILFDTNAYGVTTATYYLVHQREGQPDALEKATGGSPLKLQASSDQRLLVLTGPSESPIGTYKYPLIVLIPMKESFLSTARSRARANLRWNWDTSWNDMSEFEVGVFLEDRP